MRILCVNLSRKKSRFMDLFLVQYYIFTVLIINRDAPTFTRKSKIDAIQLGKMLKVPALPKKTLKKRL